MADKPKEPKSTKKPNLYLFKIPPGLTEEQLRAKAQEIYDALIGKAEKSPNENEDQKAA